MKTNQSNSRSENARNEKRDSNGRFESNNQRQGSKNHNTSGSNDHRGDNGKNQERDSQGRFESEDGRK